MNIMYNPARFVIERRRLESNLDILRRIEQQADISILYTLKCFNHPDGLSIIDRYLSGYSISNAGEYNTTKDMSKSRIHCYAPTYEPSQIASLATSSQTMSLNSLTLWDRYSPEISQYTSLGLRINPRLNIKQPKYCNPNLTDSRLGVPQDIFLDRFATDEEFALSIQGLHFHLFCYQGLDAFKYLLSHLSRHYQHILPRLKWLNLGGGLNLTDAGFPVSEFIEVLKQFAIQFPNLDILMEPGSAVVHTCGYLECTIMDIIPSDTPIVILNTSIESHLLDLAITKQIPSIKNSTEKGAYAYKLTGMSCIAGDIIGNYRFAKKLQVGDTIIIEDMIGYTLVKQNEFNGIDRAKLVIVQGELISAT